MSYRNSPPAVHDAKAVMTNRTAKDRAVAYQRRADEVRQLAEDKKNQQLRAELLAIADRYQALADASRNITKKMPHRATR